MNSINIINTSARSSSIQSVIKALKCVFSTLKPKLNPLTFALLIGKQHQGKSTLLAQAELQTYPLEGIDMSLYYHADGVILEISESWLSQQDLLLSHLIRQLNAIHRHVKLNALILCLDVQNFLHAHEEDMQRNMAVHVQWLKRFVDASSSAIPVSVFLTKCDGLVGFTPYFHSIHPSDGLKSLGVSLDDHAQTKQTLRQFRSRFDKLTERLNRHVLPKLHAVRSSALRTQIREFPLQFASLRMPLQGLIESLLHHNIVLHGIYLMSAASHSEPVDRLHHKFENDYGFKMIPHPPMELTHPAYFVHGAVCDVLMKHRQSKPRWTSQTHWVYGITAGIFAVLMGWISLEHLQTTQRLNETRSELQAYNWLLKSGQKPTAAVYHLSQALKSLNDIPAPMQHLHGVKKLEDVLAIQTEQSLAQRILPTLMHTLEAQMRLSSNTPVEQYEALKAYLELTDTAHFSKEKVMQWFNQFWRQHPEQASNKEKSLMDEALSKPIEKNLYQPALVRDVRNRLTALPPGYLEYALAKIRLGQSTQAFSVQGFHLVHPQLPHAYTKAGFSDQIRQLEAFAVALAQEQWVLDQSSVENLTQALTRAYAVEYVTFWNQLMKQSQVQAVANFKQAESLAKTLDHQQSFSKFLELIQTNTSPMTGIHASLFNEEIASQFSYLQLVSHQAMHELNQSVHEIENFLATLALVNDEGQTAFAFAKTRFQGEALSDSLSLLYQRARGMPEPISLWVKGFADSIWMMLIQQAKDHLNHRWSNSVYRSYESMIAHRYPFDSAQAQEVSMQNFEQFFAPQGIFARFVQDYVRPFLDTSTAQWTPKTRDGFRMPISDDMMNELIRANVISTMFFPEGMAHGKIDFTLEKVALDPVVTDLSLVMGQTLLQDSQTTHTPVTFHWPAKSAKLELNTLDGGHFNLEEAGDWAIFKMLQKLNVLVDPKDASTLQILFEINGNAGRYVLKTQHPINPFSPGILEGFNLTQKIV